MSCRSLIRCIHAANDFYFKSSLQYEKLGSARCTVSKKCARCRGSCQLVDSGADECTFPAWIAKMLGHNVYKGKQKIFSGIGGSVLAYLHKTHLILNEIELVADVYYSHEWDDMPFGLLGQAGFFSHFEVCFNYSLSFPLSVCHKII